MTDLGVVIRQRDDFSAYLRRCGVVRRDSHQLAREPGTRHWMIKGSDGWIRAFPAYDSRFPSLHWMRARLLLAGIRIVEVYVIRFKREPA